MKATWNVPDSRPLADFAPTIVLKAKDFAAEITIFNARAHGMNSESAISHEHVTNNQAVQNFVGTGHSSGVSAGRRGCEEGREAAGHRGKEVADEAGYSAIGGHAMTCASCKAQTRTLEQTIAANVAGILEG